MHFLGGRSWDMEGENNEVVAEDDVPGGLYAELPLPDRINALLAHGRDVLGIAGITEEAAGILWDVFCTCVRALESWSQPPSGPPPNAHYKRAAQGRGSH